MTHQRGDDGEPIGQRAPTSGATVLDQGTGTAADDEHVPEKQIQRWVDDGGAEVPDS
jgi:hypothetical protein